MEPEFITYKKFNDVALADALAEQLESHEIVYYIEEESFNFDPSMVMTDALVEYAVKIKPGDFERAGRLLLADEQENIADADKDYYLFSFSDDELMEVITKADEWNPFDVALARKILTEKGKTIDEAAILAINEKRIEELRAPEPPQTTWVIIGYMAALLGGVLGIFIGWHLFTYKKTLPDGERVYDYNENDRSHGRKIFYLSVVIFVIAVIYKIVLVVSDPY